MQKELINYFDDRLKKNKTATIAFSGGLGSGKSYCGLVSADDWYHYKFNKDFPLENCCFSLSEFMDRLNKGNLKPGEILILEETGVHIGSRDFMRKVNKAFNYYMQSFRALQIFVIFNLPVFELMDKATRILINCNFITQGIDYTKKVVEVKPFFHQLNQQTGKIYPKYLRQKIIRKGYVFTEKIDRLYFKIPRKELRESYEIKKKKFLKEFGESIAKDIKPKEKVEKLYPHKCVKCSYEWRSDVEKPHQCPKCRKKWYD